MTASAIVLLGLEGFASFFVRSSDVLPAIFPVSASPQDQLKAWNETNGAMEMATGKDSPSDITTTDIDCAAYIIAEGAELAALEAMEFGGRRTFHLHGERVQESVDDYVLGRATVRLETFLDARRALLDRLHGRERVR